MRLTRFLNEEDIIKKALSIGEPEVGGKYSDEEVKENIAILKDALSSKGKDADEAMIKDIQDKLDKWENVDVETEPAGPSVPAVDILAAQPPEEAAAGEEPPPEKDKKKKKKDEEE